MRWTFAICAALVGCTDNTSAPAADDASPAVVDAAQIIDAAEPEQEPPSSVDASLRPKGFLGRTELEPSWPGGAEPIPTSWPESDAARRERSIRACSSARDGGQVNETLAITIGGDGRVTAATSSGNDPNVGACLEKAMRTWMFPATGEKSTVSIPFRFAPK